MSSSESTEAFAEPAAQVRRAAAPTPILLLCDHASNAVPKAFGDLGLGPEQLESHVAYDPGAAMLTEAMAERLDAACLLCSYSRLVIDVNRAPQAHDSIVVENDNIRVPGNLDLDAAARTRRVDNVYEPYHRTVDDLLNRRQGAAGTQLVVAVHSFTPVMRGTRRPWDIGLIYDTDRRLAQALVGQLVATADDRARLTVGLNEPYSPDDRVYHSLSRHAESRGLPCVMIELPNDQLASAEGLQRWTDRLAGAFRNIVSAFAGEAGGARRATQ